MKKNTLYLFGGIAFLLIVIGIVFFVVKKKKKPSPKPGKGASSGGAGVSDPVSGFSDPDNYEELAQTDKRNFRKFLYGKLKPKVQSFGKGLSAEKELTWKRNVLGAVRKMEDTPAAWVGSWLSGETDTPEQAMTLGLLWEHAAGGWMCESPFEKEDLIRIANAAGIEPPLEVYRLEELKAEKCGKNLSGNPNLNLQNLGNPLQTSN